MYEDRTVGDVETTSFRELSLVGNISKNFVVQISNSVPVDKKTYIKDHFPSTYPGRTLVWAYQRGDITKEEYIINYNAILSSRSNSIREEWEQVKLNARGRRIVLPCWEKEGDFCHRHLLLDFLIKIGAFVSN